MIVEKWLVKDDWWEMIGVRWMLWDEFIWDKWWEMSGERWMVWDDWGEMSEEINFEKWKKKKKKKKRNIWDEININKII